MYCIERVIRGRAASPKDAAWHKTHLRVAFRHRPELRQPDVVERRIMAAAAEWSKHCAIVFERVEEWHTADIRIMLGVDGGSWSYVGRQAEMVPSGDPTMHYGWLTAELPDGEFNRVVLHEFGHALGLIHEHQSPAEGISWNKKRIYEIYSGPPNYWSKQDIEFNVLQRYDRSSTNYTEFDPNSIMLYPISADMTLDGFCVGWNSSISRLDADMVAKLYPKG